MAKKAKTKQELNIDIDAIVNAIDDEKAVEFYEKSSVEAKEILNDEKKMEDFLSKLKETLKTVPAEGTALEYAPIMISMVRSYVKKEYTQVSEESMNSIVVALLYFISPLDLIPDTLPGVGFVDDIIVISGCLDLVREDLEKFISWGKDNGREFEEVPDYDEVIKISKEHNKLTQAFFKGKK